MATEKSFQLYINEDNVKQYFSASGGALNGAAISGKYITMRTSSTTATFTMNDAGRNVLFPSESAIAHKADVWAQTIATLSSSKNTINVAVAGQNAVATERISTSLTEHTGSVSGSFTKASTSAIYTIKIANGFHAAGVRDTSITAYFNQYSCEAKTAGKGIKTASVSNSVPYEGETVTFSVDLYDGAEFGGWYSDEACTKLVSGSLTHSTPAADLVLYAKGTLNAEIYNCAAIAGENITSAAVSGPSVVSGENVTFSAVFNEGCLFDGWYSDSSYTNLVSVENPYTTAITADTTLYAKAKKKQFAMTLGAQPKVIRGTATLDKTSALFQEEVTFTCNLLSSEYTFVGWFRDALYTDLVSYENPYIVSATEDLTLYPRAELLVKTTLEVSFGQGTKYFTGNNVTLDFDLIGIQAIIAQHNQGTSGYAQYNTTAMSILYPYSTGANGPCPAKMDLSLTCGRRDIFSSLTEEDYISFEIGDSVIEQFRPNQEKGAPYELLWRTDSALTTLYGDTPIRFRCHQRESSIARVVGVNAATLSFYFPAYKYEARKAGNTSNLESISVSENIQAENGSVVYSAIPRNHSTFEGWYSDEACTQLVSTDATYYVVATTDLVLYAKASDPTSDSFYQNINGAWVEIADKAIFQKIDGTWTQVTNLTSLFPNGYYLPGS